MRGTKRLYGLALAFIVTIPLLLTPLGKTYFGIPGGLVGIAIGLIPGYLAYFAWLRAVRISEEENEDR